MAVFWLLAALLLAGTLVVVIRPLLRGSARAGNIDAGDADAAAIAVLRDQKRALDRERDAGEITAAERDAALAELARRVAEETGSGAPLASAPPARRAWAVAIALVVLVPTAAFLLYRQLGNPVASVVAATAASHEVTAQQIAAMVDALAQRLKQHPEDADGWVLLGRSYRTLERFPEAADAYAHATALITDDAGLFADYADVLGMTQGRKLAGKPTELVDRALALDPTQRKALALAGTAALEVRDYAKSLGYWQRLAAQLPPGSPEAQQVADVIAEVEESRRGGKPSSVASATPRGAQAGAPATPATTPTAKGVASSISGRVDLVPAFASKVALDDTVFIYARAAEGPRMPLAVLRIPARELPKEFSLDDSMAMAPGVKLSTTPSVVVEARISKSGNAVPQAGDLFGRSAPVKPGTSGLRITIDQAVP